MKKAIKFIHTVNHIRIRITWGLLKNINSQAQPYTSRPSPRESWGSLAISPPLVSLIHQDISGSDCLTQHAFFFFFEQKNSPSCDKRLLWWRSYGGFKSTP